MNQKEKENAILKMQKKRINQDYSKKEDKQFEINEKYDPEFPNDYESIRNDRKKAKYEEELKKKEIENIKNLEKQSKTEKIDLNLTGEEIYQQRLKKSLKNDVNFKRIK